MPIGNPRFAALEAHCILFVRLGRMLTMTTTRKRSQFIVRQLQSDNELEVCLALERGFVTDHVWQMDVRDEHDDINIRFRVVRLPREMRVDYPRDRAELLLSWRTRDCFLVAAVGEVLLGFVNLRVDADSPRGWIRDLVVNEPFRRRRIGSALLEQAVYWAASRQIRQLTLEMQTKNYPAIQFARARGFAFCGYNDRYYANRDIAVFFDRYLA